MRKISVLIIAVFILNLFIGGNVFAANVCKISASFNPSNPYQGNEVTISLSVSEITEGIAAVGFSLDYDSDVFEFSGTEKADGWSIIPVEGIQFTIHTDSYEATSDAGTIGTIKLKVKDNARLGNALIKLSNIEVAKDDSSTIAIDDLEQNILIQKEESNNTNTDTNDNTNAIDNTNTVDNTIDNTVDNTIDNTNTNANDNTNINTDAGINANTNSNANANTSNIENTGISTENDDTNTNTEKASTKVENKNSVLPYTGKSHLFIGGVLVIAFIFVIISYKKYLKYKNV